MKSALSNDSIVFIANNGADTPVLTQRREFNVAKLVRQECVVHRVKKGRRKTKPLELSCTIHVTIE